MNMTDTPFLPVEIEGAERTGRWCITCDHATNFIPDFVNGGTLGLPAADMARHIAYDIGAAGVSRHLGTLLNAPVVLSNFSRMVIDPNRGADDPTLMMRLYDGTIIPGNRHADADEIAMRKTRCYDPYHDALAEQMARPGAVMVAVHSFSPKLRARAPRPWHIGILYASDARLAHPLLDRLRAEPDLCVGENEPYPGHLPGDSVDRHALRQGRPNALLEIRQDLIETPEQQRGWAERLAPMLTDILAETGL